MSSVGIVLVSHSNKLVEGLKELLSQIQKNVQIAVAGGTDENEIGTSAIKIKQAIEEVYSASGVVILFDLGSALINTELAIEWFEKDQQQNIKIADAPLVEGSYAAVVQSGIGGSLTEVCLTAEGTKEVSKL